MASKPPTRLSVNVTPPGQSYTQRWATDEPNPAFVPNGMTFSTTIPGGFENFSCSLARRTELNFPDLTELSDITVRGVGGTIAWEGRLEQSPRTSGQQVSVNPQAVGYQANLDDNKAARMIYVDCDLSHWTSPTTSRRIALEPNWNIWEPETAPDEETGQPCVRLSLNAPWTSKSGVSEAMYDAKGIPLHSILYAWKKGATTGTTGFWQWIAGLYTDGLAAGSADGLAGAGPGKGAYNTTDHDRTWGLIQLTYGGVSGPSDTLQYPVYFTSASIVGDHGLTLRGTQDYVPGAQGFYASDIVRHAITTWAPQLNFTTGTGGTVQSDGFIIPQAVYMDPTTASAILTDVGKYDLQDWAVWENKTFYWAPRGTFAKNWRARVSPAQLQEAGPQIDRIFNGVMVQFSDVTGITRTVGPPGSGATTLAGAGVLDDPDPLNPCNAAGIKRWTMVSMGVSTPAAALKVGQKFLQETKQLNSAGSATLVGHVEDDHGVLWPAWMVRAGDYITFVDSSNPSPRRIVRTDYTHDNCTTQVSLDSPPQGLEQILQRLSVSIVPLGFS